MSLVILYYPVKPVEPLLCAVQGPLHALQQDPILLSEFGYRSVDDDTPLLYATSSVVTLRSITVMASRSATPIALMLLTIHQVPPIIDPVIVTISAATLMMDCVRCSLPRTGI